MRNVSHEFRITLLTLLAGFPAVLVSEIILWTGEYTAKVQWTLSLLILGFWIGVAAGIQERVASPLRTIANLLEAMREGDYSIRGRKAPNEDALGAVSYTHLTLPTNREV